jgi:hypothetical protein
MVQPSSDLLLGVAVSRVVLDVTVARSDEDEDRGCVCVWGAQKLILGC